MLTIVKSQSFRMINITDKSLLKESGRCLSTTGIFLLNQKWRQEKGLPMNPNARGILTDGPDYSYLDGRITPYGVRQKYRLLKEKSLNEQIIKLTAEVDFAVLRYNKILLDEKVRKEEIVKAKLKPKGLNLLKSK